VGWLVVSVLVNNVRECFVGVCVEWMQEKKRKQGTGKGWIKEEDFLHVVRRSGQVNTISESRSWCE
jgi:hypothetical protein